MSMSENHTNDGQIEACRQIAAFDTQRQLLGGRYTGNVEQEPCCHRETARSRVNLDMYKSRKLLCEIFSEKTNAIILGPNRPPSPPALRGRRGQWVRNCLEPNIEKTLGDRGDMMVANITFYHIFCCFRCASRYSLHTKPPSWKIQMAISPQQIIRFT